MRTLPWQVWHGISSVTTSLPSHRQTSEQFRFGSGWSTGHTREVLQRLHSIRSLRRSQSQSRGMKCYLHRRTAGNSAMAEWRTDKLPRNEKGFTNYSRPNWNSFRRPSPPVLRRKVPGCAKLGAPALTSGNAVNASRYLILKAANRSYVIEPSKSPQSLNVSHHDRRHADAAIIGVRSADNSGGYLQLRPLANKFIARNDGVSTFFTAASSAHLSRLAFKIKAPPYSVDLPNRYSVALGGAIPTVWVLDVDIRFLRRATP